MEHNVVVRSALSEEYVEEMERRISLFIDRGFTRVQDCLDAAGVSVNTIQAKCGDAKDEQMLVDLIRQKEGGFSRLNSVVEAFRRKELPEQINNALEQMQAKNLADDRLSVQLERVKDSDWRVRLAGVDALASMASWEVIKVASHLVLATASDPEVVVQAAAMRALCKLAPEDLVGLLPELLPRAVGKIPETDVEVRKAALEVLSKLPTAMLARLAPQLIPLLYTEPESIHSSLEHTLSKLPPAKIAKLTPLVLDSLLTPLVDPQTGAPRESSDAILLRLLMRIRKTEFIKIAPQLLRCMLNRDDGGPLHDTVQEVLDSMNRYFQATALKLQSEAPEQLRCLVGELELILKTGCKPRTRIAAIRLLGKLPMAELNRVLDAAISSALADDALGVRQAMYKMLQELPLEMVIDRIPGIIVGLQPNGWQRAEETETTQTLEVTFRHVWEAGVSLLDKLPVLSLVPHQAALQQATALHSSGNIGSNVDTEALELLRLKVSAEMSLESTLPVLLTNMSAVSTRVMQATMSLLSKCPPDTLVSLTTDRLKDSDDDVKIGAIKYLSKLPREQLVGLSKPVMPCLASKSANVRGAAVAFFGQLSPEDLLSLAPCFTSRLEHKSGTVRASVVQTLGLLASADMQAMVSRMVPRLSDRDRSVVVATLTAFSKKLSPKELAALAPQLVGALGKELPTSQNLRFVAENEIQLIADILWKVAADVPLAISSLTPELVESLGHNHNLVRLTAVNTLGRLPMTELMAIVPKIITMRRDTHVTRSQSRHRDASSVATNIILSRVSSAEQFEQLANSVVACLESEWPIQGFVLVFLEQLFKGVSDYSRSKFRNDEGLWVWPEGCYRCEDYLYDEQIVDNNNNNNDDVEMDPKLQSVGVTKFFCGCDLATLPEPGDNLNTSDTAVQSGRGLGGATPCHDHIDTRCSDFWRASARCRSSFGAQCASCQRGHVLGIAEADLGCSPESMTMATTEMMTEAAAELYAFTLSTEGVELVRATLAATAPMLVELAVTPDYRTRDAAVQVLQHVGDSALTPLIPDLMQKIQHEQVGLVRAALMEVLSSMSPGECACFIPQIVSRLQHDENHHARAAAMKLIAAQSASDLATVAQGVVASLKDRNQSVRLFGVQALCKMPSATLFMLAPQVLDMCNYEWEERDSDKVLAEIAARSIGEPKWVLHAMPDILSRLSHGDSKVRNRAQWVLLHATDVLTKGSQSAYSECYARWPGTCELKCKSGVSTQDRVDFVQELFAALVGSGRQAQLLLLDTLRTYATQHTYVAAAMAEDAALQESPSDGCMPPADEHFNNEAYEGRDVDSVVWHTMVEHVPTLAQLLVSQDAEVCAAAEKVLCLIDPPTHDPEGAEVSVILTNINQTSHDSHGQV